MQAAYCPSNHIPSTLENYSNPCMLVKNVPAIYT